MRYEGFQAWLRKRGITANAITTRSSAVRRIETVLPGLGSPHEDIDDAFRDDQFAQILATFDSIKDDFKGGGERFRIIFPDSKNPVGRLQNFRSWLGQYGQFLRGDSSRVELSSEDSYWFVGASFGRTEDQVERFLSEGIWEISNPKPNELELVRSMKVGQRIAIKAAFVQRLNLPFDNRGQNISVMRIKARGVITGNFGGGERISVEWEDDFEQRDWYFYTFRPTIWQVQPGTELADRLIKFAFFDEKQDIPWFQKHPSWKATQGDADGPVTKRFWIEKTIVRGRPDRELGADALGRALWSPQRSKDNRKIYGNMLKVMPGDVVFHLTDNAAFVGVSVAVEEADVSFFCPENTEWKGEPGYRVPLADYHELEPPLVREAFMDTEPFETELRELVAGGVKGLFYDSRGFHQGAYLTEATPTLMSILARAYMEYAGKPLPYVEVDSAPLDASEDAPPYSVDDALDDLFATKEEVEAILLLWMAKKNVILQGPPGVGKSFVAQRLAFALMGASDRGRLAFVQFHQSYSYEDFVEGYRPNEQGFELRAGKFVEFCRRAEADQGGAYVFIIDEINRGNLSKILGELMLLIEGDKRDQSWAMPLASGKVPFYVPGNVYVLGLMNTADRSLAVVDYALRRRFAFQDLSPKLSSEKLRRNLSQSGVGDGVIDALVSRIERLNKEIVEDATNLGPGFAIGHSYFCAGPAEGETDWAWYTRVIRTEIAPLLREYMFDAPAKAADWETQLLAPL